MLIKASIAAMGAVVALALILPQDMIAFGARLPPPPPPPSSSEPGGGGNPGGNGPDLPTPTPEQQTQSMGDACNGALEKLVKIPEKLVEAFDNAGGVTVVPVCNSGAGRAAKIDNSQALPLQNAIAANAALMGPLAGRGFHAEDVVGVVLVNGVATLYVHKGA